MRFGYQMFALQASWLRSSMLSSGRRGAAGPAGYGRSTETENGRSIFWRAYCRIAPATVICPIKAYMCQLPRSAALFGCRSEEERSWSGVSLELSEDQCEIPTLLQRYRCCRTRKPRHDGCADRYRLQPQLKRLHECGALVFRACLSADGRIWAGSLRLCQLRRGRR